MKNLFCTYKDIFELKKCDIFAHLMYNKRTLQYATIAAQLNSNKDDDLMPTINRKVFQDSSATASVIREVTAMVVEDRDYSTSINLRFPMDQWDAIRNSLSNANIEHHEFASGSTSIKAPIYSRFPIRNALNALCRDGLINLSFVREISVNFPDRHYGIFSLDDIEGEAELEWMWSTIDTDDELEETARQLASLDDVRRNVPIYHNDINTILATSEADTDSMVDRIIALSIPFSERLTHFTQSQLPPRVTIDSDGRHNHPLMNTTVSDYRRELLLSLTPLFSGQSIFKSTQPQRPPHVTIKSNAQKLEDIPDFQTDTIPQDYICPLSLSIMADPVYILGDATEQRFDHSWINTWLTQNGTHPTTRIKYKSTALISDIKLKNEIDCFVETTLTNTTRLRR